MEKYLNTFIRTHPRILCSIMDHDNEILTIGLINPIVNQHIVEYDKDYPTLLYTFNKKSIKKIDLNTDFIKSDSKLVLISPSLLVGIVIPNDISSTKTNDNNTIMIGDTIKLTSYPVSHVDIYNTLEKYIDITHDFTSTRRMLNRKHPATIYLSDQYNKDILSKLCPSKDPYMNIIYNVYESNK